MLHESYQELDIGRIISPNLRWDDFFRDRNWPAYRLYHIDRAGELQECKYTWTTVSGGLEESAETGQRVPFSVRWFGHAPFTDMIGTVLQNPQGEFCQVQTPQNTFTMFYHQLIKGIAISVPSDPDSPSGMYYRTPARSWQKKYRVSVRPIPVVLPENSLLDFCN